MLSLCSSLGVRVHKFEVENTLVYMGEIWCGLFLLMNLRQMSFLLINHK